MAAQPESEQVPRPELADQAKLLLAWRLEMSLERLAVAAFASQAVAARDPAHAPEQSRRETQEQEPQGP